MRGRCVVAWMVGVGCRAASFGAVAGFDDHGCPLLRKATTERLLVLATVCLPGDEGAFCLFVRGFVFGLVGGACVRLCVCVWCVVCARI